MVWRQCDWCVCTAETLEYTPREQISSSAYSSEHAVGPVLLAGPDAPNLQRNEVLKYEAVWFGWQTMNGVSGCKHEESKLHAQTAAVKDQGGAEKTSLAYGCDVSNVMTFYDKQQSALADPSNTGWFLRAPKRRSVQFATLGAGIAPDRTRAQGGTCGFESSPAWDFRNASARKYFAEVVIGQWASDPTVDSVFVDEADALVCYWSPSGPKNAGLPTLDDVYAWSNGSVLACVSNSPWFSMCGGTICHTIEAGRN